MTPILESIFHAFSGRAKRHSQAIGDCDTKMPMRLVRIDPTTGRQSYVATLLSALVGAGLDCHLVGSQGIVGGDAFYFLANPIGPPATNQYTDVVRAQVGA